MRYFVDTEFIDDGKTIDLISIGIVSEDGREYYAQSCEFDVKNASPWIVDNVFPHLTFCPHFEQRMVTPDVVPNMKMQTHLHLHGQCIPQSQCPWHNHYQIIYAIIDFCDPRKHGKPEFYGWCSAYDWVAFCQIFGTMMDLPSGYPHYMRDIQQILDERDIRDDMLPKMYGNAHNALADAIHIKQIYAFLEESSNGKKEEI